MFTCNPVVVTLFRKNWLARPRALCYLNSRALHLRAYCF